MTDINRLIINDTIDEDDLVPFWSTRNGSTRSVSAGDLADFVMSELPASFANPMVLPGDMIINGADSLPARLGAGTVGYQLTMVGTLPAWTAPSAASVAWGAITGTLSAQTDLQNALNLKQNRSPAIQSVVSSATVTPAFTNDMVAITAQAAGLTLANPTGTAIDGLGIVIRIKDNGTARSIAYGGQYRALGVTLPTTTVLSKTLYLGCIWNAADTTFDVCSVAQQA